MPGPSDDGPAADPHWELLPGQPELFFGLESGWEPLDLKRRYSALIKRYKPERFPEEFKRIRAAYEELQRRRAAPGRSAARSPWAPNMPRRRASPVTEEAQKHARLRRAERALVLIDPQSRYAELGRLALLEPQHYCTLALLSECVPDAAGRNFASWIATGLCVHPHDRVLAQWLMRAAFDVPEGEIEALLDQLQQLADDEPRTYYYATVELWVRWIPNVAPGRFMERLDALESKAVAGQESESPEKLSFLMRCLRPALWRADREWCTAKLAWLEERHRSIAGAMENELEYLVLIQKWIGKRQSIVSENALVARLDDIVRRSCMDDPELDSRFLELATEMVRDPRAMLLALPVGQRIDHDAAILWRWTIGQLGPRLQGRPRQSSACSPALANSLAREEQRRARLTGCSLLPIFVVLAVLVATLVVGFAVLRVIVSASEFLGLPAWISTIPTALALTALVWFVARPRWLKPICNRAVLRVLRVRYAFCLRARAAELLACTNIDPNSLARELALLAGPTDHPELEKFGQLVADDTALWLITWLRAFAV